MQTPWANYYANKRSQRQKQITLGKQHPHYILVTQHYNPNNVLPPPPKPDDISLSEKGFKASITKWKKAYHTLALNLLKKQGHYNLNFPPLS